MRKTSGLRLPDLPMTMAIACLSRLATAPAMAEPDCDATGKKATKAVITKIDLNKASEKELAEVPRVGIKTARAIVDHGKAINGYKSMEQLQLVRGVGEKAYGCLLKYVVIGSG